MYQVFYLDIVEEDIRSAKQWYEEQRESLGTEFVLSVKNALSGILKMPGRYPVRYKNVRIAHTKVFPYNIHFVIDEDNNRIVITGVIHNKRNDALFLNRI